MKVQRAEIVAEHRLNGVDSVHGVTFDGKALWFAHGSRGDLTSMDPASGQVLGHLSAPVDAGTAFDGQHLWVVGGERIRRLDPATGAILGEVPDFDARPVSGLAWADGALYAGVYRQKKILKIDPTTGKVLRTLTSDRLVTGVTWCEGELWHGVMREEGPVPSELRRVDAATGEVLARVGMPEEVAVTGVEADDQGRLWCGDGSQGRLLAVKKPGRAA